MAGKFTSKLIQHHRQTGGSRAVEQRRGRPAAEQQAKYGVWAAGLARRAARGEQKLFTEKDYISFSICFIQTPRMTNVRDRVYWNIMLCMLACILCARGFDYPGTFMPLASSHMHHYSHKLFFRLHGTNTNPQSSVPPTVTFSGVKFPDPVGKALLSLGIANNPSPIQAAAIPALCAGQSCALHAPTGTGKTFAYLLPALKRFFSPSTLGIPTSPDPCTMLLLVPTHELANQVAHDVRSLTTVTDSSNDMKKPPLVNIILSPHINKKSELAPIWISTPAVYLQYLQSLSAQPQRVLLKNIKYLVLDEADRLLSPPSRYLKPDSKTMRFSKIDSKTNPTNTDEEQREFSKFMHDKAYGDDTLCSIIDQLLLLTHSSKSWFQVVAASATVGRPLRRELQKLLNVEVVNNDQQGEAMMGGNEREVIHSYGDLFPVIRPIELRDVWLDNVKRRDDEGDRVDREKERTTEVGSGRNNQWIAHHNDDHESDIDQNYDGSESSRKLRFRYVTIPDNIQHKVLLVRPPTHSHPPISLHNVSLARKLAFVNTEYLIPIKRNLDMGQQAKNGKVLLFVNKIDQVNQAVHILRAWGYKQSKDLNHARSEDDQVIAINDSVIGTSTNLEIVVASIGSARGLHIPGVNYVITLETPRTMDEYLHIAGRTARMQLPGISFANKAELERKGEVLTLATKKSLRRMKAWQVPLGVDYEVLTSIYDPKETKKR